MILNPSLIKHIHCIGVGGIGVSGIAELLHRQGYQVSGSDVKASPVTTRLQSLGLRIAIGHQAEHVQSADLVIYSSAVANNNPEREAATLAGIPLASRGEILAELTQPYFSIAVAGTHGKTTSSGMLAAVLETTGRDPMYLLGGRICGKNTTVRWSHGRYCVVETDESDASFLFMRPNIAVITNIDEDHLEHYGGDFKRLQDAFLEFAGNLAEDGLLIMNIDCPVLRNLLPRIQVPRLLTFGCSEDADFRVFDVESQGLKSQFSVQRPQPQTSLDLMLAFPGRHNVLNALPAVIVAQELGLTDGGLTQALQAFPGMDRRFQYHGDFSVQGGAAMIFEDYGHHPAAITSTLAMVKQAWPDHRLVLVFQPHRYSRTRDLMDEFVHALPQADQLVLLDVYAASESCMQGGDARQLYEKIIQAGSTSSVFIPEKQRVLPYLRQVLQANDVVLFQGAGDVGQLAAELMNEHEQCGPA